MTTLQPDKTQVVSVYIVRHGETEENKLGIIQGQLDTRLNAIGWDQVEKTGESLKDIRFMIAHSSDLDRAMKTAKIILGHHPGVPLFGHTALRERNMGELQGLKVGVQLGQPASGMEPWGQVMARASAWWNEEIIAYVKSLDEGPANILITSHGGLIAALVGALVSSNVPPLQVADGVVLGRCYNASITVIELDRKTLSGKIIQYSETSHLSGQFVGNNPDEGQD